MIDVCEVRKSFETGGRQVEVLKGISVRVPEGRTAFIVGPSGSGKSTLLYLLGAMDRPSSGLIRVSGRELTTMSAREQDSYRRERVGFIFQAFNLIGNLTSVENVLVPVRPRGATPALMPERRGRACWPKSGWAIAWIIGRISFPAASNSASPSRGP